MNPQDDAMSLIERLGVFEERLQVRFESLFATASQEDWGTAINLNGEIHPADGTRLSQDVEVVVDVLDADGRLIARQTHIFQHEKLFGFESFQFYISAASFSLKQIRRIRLYPQAWP
jgi:hypothetical protein